MKHQTLQNALTVMDNEEKMTRDFLIHRTGLNMTFAIGETQYSDPRITFSIGEEIGGGIFLFEGIGFRMLPAGI